jgi:hypothetical protein
MTDPTLELLLSPGTMVEAEYQLLSRGVESLPLLESLLKGEAKNRFGVPYRQLGLPLRCALEVVVRLGPIAKPLEVYLREELRHGNHTAAMALRSLGTLEQESIIQLAISLDGGLDLAMESATALLICGEAGHPAVLEVVSRSKAAASVLERAVNHERRRRSTGSPSSRHPRGR